MTLAAEVRQIKVIRGHGGEADAIFHRPKRERFYFCPICKAPLESVVMLGIHVARHDKEGKH